jgi:hypothetical protein
MLTFSLTGKKNLLSLDRIGRNSKIACQGCPQSMKYSMVLLSRNNKPTIPYHKQPRKKTKSPFAIETQKSTFLPFYPKKRRSYDRTEETFSLR